MKEEYISVSEMAQYLHKSSQQVYNLLHSGELSGVEFRRGSMRGWLCHKPADYDTWKNKETQNKKQ